MKRICIPIDMRAATRIKSAGGGNNCGIGEDGDAQYTLTTLKSFVPGVFYMECYEQHMQDSRIRGPLKKIPSLSSSGGGQQGMSVLIRDKAEFYENHGTDSRVKGPYEVCPTLTGRMGTGGGNTPLVRDKEEEMEIKGEYIVRRLMPVECERLQGFPDGYTDIPWPNAEHAPDSHRYKALGNSMAVPVMRWIGERIEWSLSHPITEDKSDKIPWQPELF